MLRENKKFKSIFKSYPIPSTHNDLADFITSKKTEMMEQTVSAIEYAVKNRLSSIEVFNFKNSNFSVVLVERDFLPNLDHIYNYYIEKEMYEYCSRVTNIKKGLENIINETKTHRT